MCKKIVEETWERNQSGLFHDKLKSCSSSLAGWGQEITGNFKRRIAHSNKIIRTTRGRRDDLSVKQFQEESKKLTEVLTQQEVFWKQRSKQLWLKEGDQNSKFFHASAKARRKSNQIRELKDDEGNSVGWDTGLQELMVAYFDNLFMASEAEWERVVDYMHSPVTEVHNSHAEISRTSRSQKCFILHAS